MNNDELNKKIVKEIITTLLKCSDDLLKLLKIDVPREKNLLIVKINNEVRDIADGLIESN